MSESVTEVEVTGVTVPEGCPSPIRVFEGFAGYGGATFGFRRSGLPFEVVGYSEFDRAAIQIYERNHPGVHNYGDITKIVPEELPDFDIFTGGFPCQPFSMAGMNKGEMDSRGTLFHDIIRICECKKPRWVLLENVKGLTTQLHINTLYHIQREFERIGYGRIVLKVFCSCDYGIPQERERVWIFAQYGGLPRRFDMDVEKLPLRGRFMDFLDKNPPKELYLSEERVNAFIKKYGNALDVGDGTPKAFEGSYEGGTNMRGTCPTITDDHYALWVLESVEGQKSFGSKQPIVDFNVDRPSFFSRNYSGKMSSKDTMYTLLGYGNGEKQLVCEPKSQGGIRLRKLSVDELFRFMGFEDGELDYAGLTYSQLYKRAGNGWDVNFVGLLLRHLFRQLGYGV